MDKSTNPPQSPHCVGGGHENRKPLSELMREGIREIPVKIKVKLFDGRWGACALGCAIYARYGVRDIDYFKTLQDEYPELNRPYRHPFLNEDGVDWNLIQIIMDLNDYQRWTREDIVLWLESEGL